MQNFTKDQKWLLVSCLQKAIRKGFADLAVDYAESLYEIDKNYLFYRLSIIAIEDIGLGNVDLIHDFMQTQIKRVNIEAKGGKEYVLNIVRNFAESVKDRSACDLCSLAFLNDYSSRAAHEEIFLNNNAPIVERLISGWEVLGAKKLKNPLIANKEDNLEKFMSINERLIKNEKILDIMKNCYLIHREPHFIAIGLLYSLLQKEKDEKIGKFMTGDVVEKNYNPVLINNNWLIDAIDWHTKEGKSAIYNFCKEKNDMMLWLDKHHVHEDLRANLVGMLLFRAVGHHVNKRMVYPTAIVVMKLAQKISLEKISESDIDFVDTMKVFEQSLPNLNNLLKQTLTTPDPKYFPF